jgi:hypothetical protein
MKTCSKCSTQEPSLFPSRGSICRPCRAAAQRAWNAAHPEQLRSHRAKSYRATASTEEGKARLKAYKAKYAKQNAERTSAKRYGLTLEQLQDMKVAQKGLCAICHQPETASRGGKTKELHIDHDHRTNKVRGLLCGKCNVVIGMMDEDPTRLRAAIDYLTKDF